jgi:hypothetical protein
VGGISLPEINLLEREFLLAIDYRLSVRLLSLSFLSPSLSASVPVIFCVSFFLSPQANQKLIHTHAHKNRKRDKCVNFKEAFLTYL